MAESFIQVPVDSSGKKLHTISKTVGSNTVEEQVGYVTDGNDEAQGAKADSAYAGSGSASVIAILKGLYSLLAGTLTIKRALGTTTKSTYTVTTSSAQAVASNTSRKSLRIVNPTTSTTTVYLEFGATAATTSSVTYLAPGDVYYETEASDSVNAIRGSGTAVLTIFEVA